MWIVGQDLRIAVELVECLVSLTNAMYSSGATMTRSVYVYHEE